MRGRHMRIASFFIYTTRLVSLADRPVTRLSPACHAHHLPALTPASGDDSPMTDLSTELSPRKAKPIRTAVYQNKVVSKEGFSERLFALAFSGLVYPQIWEDPEIDMEAMQLGEGHRLVTIASGGCNILAYLTRSPATVDAV